MRPSRWLGPLLASGSILLAVSGGTRAAPGKVETRIAVILSQDAQPYQEALTGFRRYIDGQGIEAQFDVQALHGDVAVVGQALQSARAGGADLVLALGSIGAQAAARDVHDVPIVAGLVLNADDLGKAPNVTAVVLEFPVETELRFLQRLLPGQRNVGVLFNPSENQARIDAAARAAAGLGLNLIARKVMSPMDLPDALESLNRRADVLWGVPDQVVLNSQTARPILLFSLRNRIPFVGLSEMWVKAGALYALDRDYGDIGTQCGEMAVKILGGAQPSTLPTATPRRVVYSVNLKSARLLKVGIKTSVLQSAQTVVE
jgi:putative tryptophan/tyrosine transport system substrate-binding protein